MKLNGVGKNFRSGYGSLITPSESFTIGDNFFSGPHCRFTSNTKTKITIGSNVMMGPHCFIIGGNHNISWDEGPMNKAPLKGNSRGISIENDVWIGANVIVLDGSNIGEGSVIGAGSVVRGRIPPYSVCIGNPVIIKRCRFDENSLKKVLIANSSEYSVNIILAEYNKVAPHLVMQ